MLPEGPAGNALQEMTKPKRIAITDSFWLGPQIPVRLMSCCPYAIDTHDVAENYLRVFFKKILTVRVYL